MPLSDWSSVHCACPFKAGESCFSHSASVGERKALGLSCLMPDQGKVEPEHSERREKRKPAAKEVNLGKDRMQEGWGPWEGGMSFCFLVLGTSPDSIGCEGRNESNL